MIRKCSVTGFFPRIWNLHDPPPPPQIQCGIYLASPKSNTEFVSPPPQHFSNEHFLMQLQCFILCLHYTLILKLYYCNYTTARVSINELLIIMNFRLLKLNEPINMT